MAVQRHWRSQTGYIDLVSSCCEVLPLVLPDSPVCSITITGWAVLGGHTRIKDPNANFRDAFAGTTRNGNGVANALVKINFAYSGYQNAFNLVNETKVLWISVAG